MNCIFCGKTLTGILDTFGPTGYEYCGAMECQQKATNDEQVQALTLSPRDLMHGSIVLGYTGDLGLAMMTALKPR